MIFYLILPSLSLDSFYALDQNLEKQRKFDIPDFSDDQEQASINLKPVNDYIPPSDSDYNLEKDDLFPKINVKDIIDSPLEEELSKKEELSLMADKLNRLIGEKDLIKPITDSGLWQRLYKYIKDHLDEFTIDGHLGIELHIKYIFCVYIIAFVPAQFVVAFPAFLPKLLPRQAFKIPILKDILLEMNSFLKFVRFQSKKTYVIPFFLGKKNSLTEDLEVIKRVPELLFKDPKYLFTTLFAFQVNAKGYKEFKKNENVKNKKK